MRKNISNVISAFKRGVAHREATCSTDGTVIKSYAMTIAERNLDGTVWIIDREEAPSVTTRSQIDAVRRSI